MNKTVIQDLIFDLKRNYEDDYSSGDIWFTSDRIIIECEKCNE